MRTGDRASEHTISEATWCSGASGMNASVSVFWRLGAIVKARVENHFTRQRRVVES